MKQRLFLLALLLAAALQPACTHTVWGEPESRPDTVSTAVADTVPTDTVILTLPSALQKKKSQKKVRPFGIAVGADLVGAGMRLVGCDWRQMEVLARINIKDKYFPIFEMGIGEADHEGREIDNRYKTRAPYFRVGADYNFTKKHNGNRLFLGLRYAFSAYNYDIYSHTPLADPVWGTPSIIDYSGLHGRTQWAEVVLGVETRLWSIVRMGWDMRVKFRLHQNADPICEPWYVPGMGKTGGSTVWGGTFKILFDI